MRGAGPAAVRIRRISAGFSTPCFRELRGFCFRRIGLGPTAPPDHPDFSRQDAESAEAGLGHNQLNQVRERVR